MCVKTNIFLVFHLSNKASTSINHLHYIENIKTELILLLIRISKLTFTANISSNKLTWTIVL